VVGVLATGSGLDELPGVLRVGEGVGGTHLTRLLQLERNGVDHDDVLGPGVGGALHRVDAHAAAAVDHHGLPGLYPGGVDGASPTGGDAAAHEGRDVERDVVVKPHAGEFADHRALGEGADRAHAADVATVAGVEPVAVVLQHARDGVAARVAEVLPAGRAVAAGAADGNEGAHDAVAHPDTAHPGAGLLHHAGGLVPADHRVADGHVAGADVVVGVAQACRLEADQHLAVLRVVEVEIDDVPLLAGLPHDGGAGGGGHGQLQECGGGTGAGGMIRSRLLDRSWRDHSRGRRASSCGVPTEHGFGSDPARAGSRKPLGHPPGHHSCPTAASPPIDRAVADHRDAVQRPPNVEVVQVVRGEVSGGPVVPRAPR
jgi:hypothetical protein